MLTSVDPRQTMQTRDGQTPSLFSGGTGTPLAMPAAPSLNKATKRALVRDGYDRIADREYELGASPAEGHARRTPTEGRFRSRPTRSTVLDLGCGPGLPVGRFAVDAGHLYTGLDVSQRQIELARTHVPEGTFDVGDAVEATFGSETFDAVLMLYALTHVPRDEWHLVFEKVHGWLRSSGKFLLNVPANDDPGWLEENFLGTDEQNWTNAYGPQRTTELLNDVGLVVLESRLLPDDVPGGPGWHWITTGRR
jgi:SAM-dependent methyltransferase